MKDTVYAIAGLLAVAIFVGGATYSCTYTTRAYNELATKCVEAQGSWVVAPGASSGQCIK